MSFALAALGISAASSAVGFLGAKNADKKAKQQARQDAELARHATEVQIESIVAAKEESENATELRMSDISRQAAIARGRILAAAGEANVSGASISDQLLTSFAEESNARGRELYNLSATKRQYSRDISAAEAGLAVNLPRHENTAPSAGAMALGTAARLLSIKATSDMARKR